MAGFDVIQQPRFNQMRVDGEIAIRTVFIFAVFNMDVVIPVGIDLKLTCLEQRNLFQARSAG